MSPTGPFRIAVPLRWVDVDAEGIVNNAVYASLMEQARYQYFAALLVVAGGKVPFVLAEATTRYLRPGRHGMRTEVTVRTTRLQNSSFRMEYEVLGDGEVLVTSEVVLVWVGPDLRPCPIPDAVRQAIAAREGIVVRA
ncbi:MAG: acyl-CoA thioesterase [Planctomycetes bacterium]|nr:acyl-CoA thioesterase [Planctomycetota bacterium]